MSSKSRQNSNTSNRLSVADRAALLTKVGTREGEFIWQADIGLGYVWTDIQGIDNGGTIINVDTTGSWIASYSGSINALWFGVKIDGTETSTEIQAFFDYGNTSGSPMFFPQGTYTIGTTISIGHTHRDMKVECSKKAYFVGTDNTVDLFDIEGQRRIYWDGGVFKKGKRIFFTSTTNTVAYCNFINMHFSGDAVNDINTCFEAQSSIGTYWNNCMFGDDAVDDQIKYGVRLPNTSTNQTNINKFTDCVFMGISEWAVYADDSIYTRLDNTFNNCWFEQCSNGVMYFGTSSRTVGVYDCYMENAGSPTTIPFQFKEARVTVRSLTSPDSFTSPTHVIDVDNCNFLMDGKSDITQSSGRKVCNLHNLSISRVKIHGVILNGTGTENYKEELFTLDNPDKEYLVEWDNPSDSSTLDNNPNLAVVDSRNHNIATVHHFNTSPVGLVAEDTYYDLALLDISSNHTGFRLSVDCGNFIQNYGRVALAQDWLVYYNTGTSLWEATQISLTETSAGKLVFSLVHVSATQMKLKVKRTVGTTATTPVSALLSGYSGGETAVINMLRITDA